MKWLPNALTILRCVLAFVVGWAILQVFDNSQSIMAMRLYGIDGEQIGAITPDLNWRWIAFISFLAGAILDFLDGWLARRWNVESDFGRLLDPIADKLLVGIPLIALTIGLSWSVLGPVLALPTISIVGRDVLITALRFSSKGGSSTHVSVLAKWKTTIEFVAIMVPLGFLAMSTLYQGYAIPFAVGQALGLGWLVLLHIAAALSLYTGYQYVRAARRSAS